MFASASREDKEMKKIIISVETYERFKLYSEVTGETMYDSIDEALNFWMDTMGAAEIELKTGVDVAPLPSSEFATSPVTIN